MHHLIYETCEDVKAVFHGHNELIVKYAEKLNVPVTTKEHESGTTELAKEVLKVIGYNKLIVLRNHGFVCIGTTMKEAGEQSLATLSEAKKERAHQQYGIGC